MKLKIDDSFRDYLFTSLIIEEMDKTQWINMITILKK
jgi:hypothetical protein